MKAQDYKMPDRVAAGILRIIHLYCHPVLLSWHCNKLNPRHKMLRLGLFAMAAMLLAGSRSSASFSHQTAKEGRALGMFQAATPAPTVAPLVDANMFKRGSETQTCGYLSGNTGIYLATSHLILN